MVLNLSDADRKWLEADLAAAEPYDEDDPVLNTLDGDINETIHDPSGIPSDLTGSYSYHNHPTSQTQGSFSAADVRFFFKSGATYSKSSDHLYEYVMRRSSDTLAVDPDLVYHRFDEVYWSDAMQLAFEEKIDAELDAYHETMLRLSEEYHFFYERRPINET